MTDAIPFDQHPGASHWAVETLRAIQQGIQDGSIARCPHVSNEPSTVHAIDLKYRRTSCLACVGDMYADLAETPATCDRCTRSGLDLYDSQAYISGVILHYTVCADCAALEDAELAEVPSGSATARQN